jgi:hypothetical protein
LDEYGLESCEALCEPDPYEEDPMPPVRDVTVCVDSKLIVEV